MASEVLPHVREYLTSHHHEVVRLGVTGLMNLGRPFLIGLLEAGEIEYLIVGRHRRIKAQSLMEYVTADDRQRREAADELTQLNRETGLL